MKVILAVEHTFLFAFLICWDFGFLYTYAPPQWSNMYVVIFFQHQPNRVPATQYLVHKIVFDDRKVHKYFSVLNFKIICIKSFTCNNTIFSVSFLNELLFLHVFLSTIIIDLHLKLDRTLTDWLWKYSWVIFLPKCIHILQLCCELF